MYKILCYAKDPSHPPVARVSNTVYSFRVASKPTAAVTCCGKSLVPRLS